MKRHAIFVEDMSLPMGLCPSPEVKLLEHN